MNFPCRELVLPAPDISPERARGIAEEFNRQFGVDEIRLIRCWKSEIFFQKWEKEYNYTLMLTNEEAEMLLKIPKRVVGGNRGDAAFLSRRVLPRDSSRLDLVAEDGTRRFLLKTYKTEADKTAKRALKLSLHHQTAHPDNMGLLRVDYGSGHKNPGGDVRPEDLPERFRPHIDKRFAQNVSHIHHYVAGFVDLPWAVPLSEDEFPVKEIRDENSVWMAFRAFGAAIGLAVEFAP